MAVTYEAWVNAAAWVNPDGDARMQIQGVGGAYVWVNKTTGTVQVARTTTGSSRQSQTSAGLSTGAWNHVVTTYDSAGDNMWHIYVDGSEASYALQTAGSGTNGTDAGKFTIGANPPNEFAYNFPGAMDEVRVASTARSADWIATEYANQLSCPVMSSFYSIGSFTQNLSDILAISDAISRGITASKADVINLVESFNKAIILSFTEMYILLDYMLYTQGLIFHEVFSILERFSVHKLIEAALAYFRRYILDIGEIQIPSSVPGIPYSGPIDPAITYFRQYLGRI